MLAPVPLPMLAPPSPDFHAADFAALLQGIAPVNHDGAAATATIATSAAAAPGGAVTPPQIDRDATGVLSLRGLSPPLPPSAAAAAEPSEVFLGGLLSRSHTASQLDGLDLGMDMGSATAFGGVPALSTYRAPALTLTDLDAHLAAIGLLCADDDDDDDDRGGTGFGFGGGSGVFGGGSGGGGFEDCMSSDDDDVPPVAEPYNGLAQLKKAAPTAAAGPGAPRKVVAAAATATPAAAAAASAAAPLSVKAFEDGRLSRDEVAERVRAACEDYRLDAVCCSWCVRIYLS